MRTLAGRWAMLLSLLISGAGIARGSDPAPSVPSSSRAVTRGADVPPPELVSLDPGTQLDQALPPGWTHLVVKSVPRLESGDLESLPEMARGTAALFRTAILAEVKPIGEGPQAPYG